MTVQNLVRILNKFYENIGTSFIRLNGLEIWRVGNY